jgi:hypothetical protein
MEGSLPLASRADTRPVADPHRVDCTANGGELDIGELHESRYTEHPGNTGLPDHAHAYNATDRLRTDAAALDGNADEHEASLCNQKQAPGCGHESDRIADGAVASGTRPRTVGPCNVVSLRVLPLPAG